MMHKLTIFLGSEAFSVRVPEEVAQREIDNWAAFERESADAVAEARASFGGEQPYFAQEFYVRQVTGKDPETGRAKTVAYRLHDLTNMMTVQEESETPA